MRRVVATAAHEVPNRAPLQLSVGDLVTIGERDTDWPAFIFVTADSGAGWVPSRHLSVSGDGAEVILGYDTTELATEMGEVLEVVTEDIESGWFWCRAESGAEGWVPITKLVEAEGGSR